MSLIRMHRLPAETKMDLQARIAAMSAVHEHLYRFDRFVEVDAADLGAGPGRAACWRATAGR